MKHIEDTYYESVFWGYAENEKDFTDFLLSLWNKRYYDWRLRSTVSIGTVFKNSEIFFDNVRAMALPGVYSEGDKIEYPLPTETDKYIIGKKPHECEYPVVILLDVTNDKDRVLTWVSLNKLKGRD